MLQNPMVEQDNMLINEVRPTPAVTETVASQTLHSTHSSIRSQESTVLGDDINDETWRPTESDEDEDEEFEDYTQTSELEEPINELFKRCQECGSPIVTRKYASIGSMLSVKTKCANAKCDKKIIDFFVHQKGIEPGDLEKYACQACLTRTTAELGEKQIFTFLSDRHRGVAKMVRELFPEIFHSYDIWHLSKSLSKKLSKAATKYPLLAKWRDSILLHLWFSCANCNENEDHLIELFLSLLNHIRNKHSWSGGAFVNKCGHGRLGRRAKNKMWLNNRAANPGNNTDAEFAELNKIINNKSFLNDLKHAKLFLHSGDVEMYHNERLVLLPKRLHFSYEGTMMRSTIQQSSS
ncbi:hypothetical protein B566_EDAN002122 [Ephemera danica]|nr:hypothetical protein B566_EDAN002122 [Ephemera danica]